MLARSLQEWSFTQVGGGEGTKEGEWLQTSEFPTSVHVELLKLKKIPDPFVGLHEWDVQWVGESDWAFKSTFTVTDEELRSSHIDLVFDGLDTFAKIDLNGRTILETSNQFVSHRISAKETLKVGVNELVLTFESAFLKGRDIEKKHGKFALWNGDSSRLHVRKAQYNYGWDWGPVLMTVGPWKPISIQFYESRIVDLDVRSAISEALDVKLTADTTFSEKASGVVSFVLKAPDGSIEASATRIPTDAGHAKVSFDFAAGKLDLWYPVGYGKQPLYTFEAELANENGEILDTKTLKIAFRRARVVQDKLIDQEGLTFLFEINNIRIFCGGSNWIPADSFLTTVTPDRYRAWLQLMVDGNQNMVRVWGGGIYERDAFYEICDGKSFATFPTHLLVWQDFMFGCGQYPAYDSFLESVKVEAEQNVKRLRHHPSIVIFAGNNEDYQVAEALKLELDYDDETVEQNTETDKKHYLDTNFPARYIYERTLPDIVNKYSDIHYHRGSPYSGHGKPTTDKTLGDLHQWNVWHGSQEPWHNWDILAGRFVSEFGMEGYPNIRTVDHWLGGDKAERFPQSRTNNNHNKADGFERRLELYLVENFRHSFEMESYVYYTQVMQAETLASAYRLWRRNWQGKGREYTAGALVWQINDCWPVTSWAIVDYFLRPKPAFFTVSRELRPFTVGMTRKEHKTFPDERSAAKFTIETKLEIWGTNSTLADKKVTLEVTSFELDSEWRDTWTKEVVLAQNSSTELYKGGLPGQPVRTKQSEVPRVIIVSARLIADGEVLGRYSNWPEPFKFIRFPAVEELGLKAAISADGESVTLSANKPIKGIVLDAEGDDVKWSDQAIDLVPDDPQTVKAVGLKGREVKLRYLGDGSA
ncbi:glycoside hydrolase family 2 protein [Lyophyllum atratum]|nr:glycoside hydrolase family 2 protein [Lyophyllum atratum]